MDGATLDDRIAQTPLKPPQPIQLPPSAGGAGVGMLPSSGGRDASSMMPARRSSSGHAPAAGPSPMPSAPSTYDVSPTTMRPRRGSTISASPGQSPLPVSRIASEGASPNTQRRGSTAQLLEERRASLRGITSRNASTHGGSQYNSRDSSPAKHRPPPTRSKSSFLVASAAISLANRSQLNERVLDEHARVEKRDVRRAALAVAGAPHVARRSDESNSPSPALASGGFKSPAPGSSGGVTRPRRARRITEGDEADEEVPGSFIAAEGHAYSGDDDLDDEILDPLATRFTDALNTAPKERETGEAFDSIINLLVTQVSPAPHPLISPARLLLSLRTGISRHLRPVSAHSAAPRAPPHHPAFFSNPLP